MNKLFIVSLLATSTLLSHFTPAARADVIINGEYLDGTEALAILEAYLQTSIPDGNYWINFDNGNWGYAGNKTIRGNIIQSAQENAAYLADQAAIQETATNHSSTSYSSGGANGYGSYSSDGQCSYASYGGMTVKSCN